MDGSVTLFPHTEDTLFVMLNRPGDRDKLSLRSYMSPWNE